MSMKAGKKMMSKIREILSLRATIEKNSQIIFGLMKTIEELRGDLAEKDNLLQEYRKKGFKIRNGGK